jgi:hypothetical protein
LKPSSIGIASTSFPAVVFHEGGANLFAVHAGIEELVQLLALLLEAVARGAHRAVVHRRLAAAATAHDFGLELLAQLAPRQRRLRAASAGRSSIRIISDVVAAPPGR